MQSTLNPKQPDDPHDVLAVAPDVVPVAPTDEELSRLARAMRQPSKNPPTRAGSDLPAGPAVPPVDTTFRPAAVGDVRVPGRRWSIGGRAARALTAALLLAALTGAASVAWQSYGDAAEWTIAQWAPHRLFASILPLEEPALPAQPVPRAVAPDAANAALPQPEPVAQTAPEAVAPAAVPSVEAAQSLQSMARDIASVGQEIEQLKASIEQLKASQQQMSRDIAGVSEARLPRPRLRRKASELKASGQNLRPRMSALPPRPAAARARKPMPPLPPPQAAAAVPALPQAAAPQAAAPYVPRQPEQQPPATAQPQVDPELASVPRPPMPDTLAPRHRRCLRRDAARHRIGTKRVSRVPPQEPIRPPRLIAHHSTTGRPP